MKNPWMVFTVKESDNDLNMRFIILALLKKFNPIAYKGCIEVTEKPSTGEIVIKTSSKNNADSIYNYLDVNGICYC